MEQEAVAILHDRTRLLKSDVVSKGDDVHGNVTRGFGERGRNPIGTDLVMPGLATLTIPSSAEMSDQLPNASWISYSVVVRGKICAPIPHS